MRTRRFRALPALAAALAMALTACGGGGENQLQIGSDNKVTVDKNAKFEQGTTMAKLKQAGTIRIGTKIDQPLFGQHDLEGNPQGFDVEIAKIIAGKLGIPPEKIQWVEAPSKTREELIEQDKVDMITATYTINDTRSERVSFAGPYYEAGQDIMIKSDNNDITGPESLRSTGAKVCTATGSTPAEEIKKYIDPQNLVLFDVLSKCADALRTGQVQAVTTDNVILMGLVTKSGGQFKVVGKPFTSEPYGVGISKGDVKFCEFINQSLAESARDNSYQRAWNSTAGTVSQEKPTLPQPNPCS